MKSNVSTNITDWTGISTNDTGMRVYPLPTFPVPEKGPNPIVFKELPQISIKELKMIHLMNHSKKARVRKKNYNRYKREYLIPFYNTFEKTVVGEGRKAVVLKRIGEKDK